MKRFVIPVICVVVVGCAAPANPPSLLPRAIEKQTETVAARPSMAAPAGIAPALALKINALLIEAKAGNADFVKTEAAGSRTLVVGRNAPQGSEVWIAAELVRSALQVARQRSAGALAEIDTLAINQGEVAARTLTTGGLPEILSAQADIEAIVARQTARLEAFSH